MQKLTTCSLGLAQRGSNVGILVLKDVASQEDSALFRGQLLKEHKKCQGKVGSELEPAIGLWRFGDAERLTQPRADKLLAIADEVIE
jgi:hypothetical protein